MIPVCFGRLQPHLLPIVVHSVSQFALLCISCFPWPSRIFSISNVGVIIDIAIYEIVKNSSNSSWNCRWRGKCSRTSLISSVSRSIHSRRLDGILGNVCCLCSQRNGSADDTDENMVRYVGVAVVGMICFSLDGYKRL